MRPMELATFLKTEMTKRQAKNPRYSLRAFAKSVDLDAGTLTRIMNGQRLVKPPTAISIMSHLDVTAEIQEEILTHLDSNRKTKGTSKTKKMEAIAPDTFEDIFETTNIHLLASFRIRKYANKRNWDLLAKNLQISTAELHHRIQSLEKVGAIQVKPATVEVIAKNISTLPIPFTTEKRKTVQKEFLEQAKRAIDEVPFELRDNCTLTIPISAKDLQKIKTILQKARTRINEISERKTNNEHLYNVSMAVYPVIL